MKITEYRELLKGEKPKQKRTQHEENLQITYFRIVRFDLSLSPVLDYIRSNGEGAYKLRATAGKQKASGMARGRPDIHIPAARHGYHAGWIELKYGKNTLTADQEKYIAYLRSENNRVEVAYSLDEALDFTDWYLGIKLQRGEPVGLRTKR